MKAVEVRNDGELPPWLLRLIEMERGLASAGGFPTSLGSPGFRTYRLGEGPWWAWDNGTGGVILGDGTTTLNLADIARDGTVLPGNCGPRQVTKEEGISILEMLGMEHS